MPDGQGHADRFEAPVYPYATPPELAEGTGEGHYPVVIVGAGPVGLAAAAEFAMLGRRTLVLDDNDTVSVGSRAICWAKRTLEIFDRLGVGDRMVDKGVTWKLGRLYHREREVYNFDLLPEVGHKMPAFINLQQYYAEAYLVDRLAELGLADLRWRNRVTGVENLPDGRARLAVSTPDGEYTVTADAVLAADGVRSPMRGMLGEDFAGKVFEDRFLIADVKMKADFPSERWFWFEPPFHGGDSALLHKQPDDVFRIDFQLGWDADPEEEKKPERVIPRIRQMLGPDTAFELEWVSVYTFTCRRMDRFRHGPIFFVGDSAHVVSPFGARGGNGGVQDVDNLCWKLDRVLKGEAPDPLLDSYDAERVPAADENILNSSRSTDFMTPKSQVSRDFRDAVLDLAAEEPFARKLVNSGRLSLPHRYAATPLSSPDSGTFDGGVLPGAPVTDALLLGSKGPVWLTCLTGHRFVVLQFVEDLEDAAALEVAGADVLLIGREGQPCGGSAFVDADGTALQRYAAEPGTAYLIRPDQHVAARARGEKKTLQEAMQAAISTALGSTLAQAPEQAPAETVR